MRYIAILLVLAATVAATFFLFPQSEMKMLALLDGVRTSAPAFMSAEANPAAPNGTSVAAPAATGPASASTNTAAGNAAPHSVASAAPGTPVLAYWFNGAEQHESQSLCAMNSLPSITFYVQYYLCNSKCLGGWWSNPYQWTITIFNPAGTQVAQTTFDTATVWINWPLTVGTPLQQGTYHAVLKLAIENFWGTYVPNTTWNVYSAVTFTAPATPLAQAPAPTIWLDTLANPNNPNQYSLEASQTNAVPSRGLAGQWDIVSSNAAGTYGTNLYSSWVTPGHTFTSPPYFLNHGSYYILQYGNYNACFSWNSVAYLIYIGPANPW
jgi:hypothetical protein